ncbi:MAG TPA: hypothetical protein VIK84_07705 [Haloplasmataceae bacterium]
MLDKKVLGKTLLEILKENYKEKIKGLKFSKKTEDLKTDKPNILEVFDN